MKKLIATILLMLGITGFVMAQNPSVQTDQQQRHYRHHHRFHHHPHRR
jgi:hypothetical protein